MKVGDYVRTKDGYIGMIDKLNSNDSVLHSIKMQDGYFLLQENNFKSSPNIIDLIEVGDYVNGYKVVLIDVKTRTLRVDGFSWGTNIFEEVDIKSIVTKENFESIQYKVGD